MREEGGLWWLIGLGVEVVLLLGRLGLEGATGGLAVREAEVG